MQDIAACRLVVPDITRQDHVVTIVKDYFDNVRVVDRRENPSHGYRAVQLIIKCSGKIIEVQVRTSLQHLWAEISEKISDKDPMVKYGGGDKKIVDFLDRLSKLFYDTDLIEYKAAALVHEKIFPRSHGKNLKNITQKQSL
jgi:ppGpp synthetase/RelA/SpoT-type nucleotidyltranferase